MPALLGESVMIFDHADHVDNVVTRRSHTGILTFVNKAFIVVYSKKQKSVECLWIKAVCDESSQRFICDIEDKD